MSASSEPLQAEPGLDRRVFLRDALLIAGASIAGGLALSACGPNKHEATSYPKHQVVATFFYIGEKAGGDNAKINNVSTEWESDARTTFGGVDNPDKRTPQGLPDFKPKENPFYFALPASEFSDSGLIKGAREASPWAAEANGWRDDDSHSLFKGRWIEVNIPGSGKRVYGQWLDTGPSDDPNATRDYGYVFGDGSEQPKNTYGLKAGIDLSYAMAFQLGIDINKGSAEVEWRFVDGKDVPDGLWRTYPPIDNETHWDN